MVHFYTRILALLIGLISGIFIAKTCKHSVKRSTSTIPTYNRWFQNQGLIKKHILWDTLRYNHNLEHTTEANYLFHKIRILCVILVRSEKNAKASESTWAKGCNHVQFIEIKTRNKPVPIKRIKEQSSWILLCKNLKNISGEYDWVLIVNDNSFVIMENLRYYLAPLEATAKYYLGYAVTFWSTIYNSAQAGYVISRGTVDAFREKFTQTDCSTNTYWNREDFYLGRHLSSLNITPIDTRDPEGFSRFHPHNWHQLFFPGEDYYKTSVFPTKCCSKRSISFQAIEADKMYTYHYLLYTLQIFSYGNLGNRPLPHITDDKEVWRTFLRERNIHNDNITSEQYYKVWEDLVNDPTSFGANMKKENNFDYD
ncbi:hypothetical protein JTB14_005125 [Gonioctena quinquepunctata]|nr:hypothetical protein JTB14_005125 [Gonioctena quinquepunctata]